jgi:hypothetical protein
MTYNEADRILIGFDTAVFFNVVVSHLVWHGESDIMLIQANLLL